MWFFSFNLKLICTFELFKKRNQKNSLVQINFKLNEKNRMITYKKSERTRLIFLQYMHPTLFNSRYVLCAEKPKGIPYNLEQCLVTE